jgi:hypothetical protein
MKSLVLFILLSMSWSVFAQLTGSGTLGEVPWTNPIPNPQTQGGMHSGNMCMGLPPHLCNDNPMPVEPNWGIGNGGACIAIFPPPPGCQNPWMNPMIPPVMPVMPIMGFNRLPQKYHDQHKAYHNKLLCENGYKDCSPRIDIRRIRDIWAAQQM